MLNKIIIMGRLTREPELKYTPANVAVCTITLACERDYAAQGQERETDFIDLVCWRQTAEFVSKYFRKGQLVAAEGRLQSRKWVDKTGGNRVSWEVLAEHVYFAERAQGTQGAQPAPKAAAQSGYDRITGAAQSAGVPVDRWPEYNEDGYEGMADDDVPF